MAEKNFEEELQLVNNSLQSCLQYDNAYFMNAYTICRDIISDRCGDNTELEVALLRPAEEVSKYCTRVELLAISMLMEIPNIVDDKAVQKLATAKNTVINSLVRKNKDGFSTIQPIKYANYLCKIVREGFDDLFICEMCYLKTEVENATCVDEIISLAYIDTLLDMGNLKLQGTMYEVRNNFSIAINKASKKYNL